MYPPESLLACSAPCCRQPGLAQQCCGPAGCLVQHGCDVSKLLQHRAGLACSWSAGHNRATACFILLTAPEPAHPAAAAT